VAVWCPSCGIANGRDSNYCGGCGHELTKAAGAVRTADPRRLRQEARRVRPAFEGERKQVTVLFADLGGSLGVIDGVDVEDAESLLDAVVAIMVEAVHRFEGTVNEVLGDGIMALFGAPIAHEDHAVRAACAALAMQASLRRLRSDSWQARGLTPEIRVGLNSGEAIVRSVHNDLSLNYRAIGSTTHLAARMEQLAPRGSIHLTEEVLRMGRGMLRARPLGATLVKGLNEPIHTFELTGVTTRTRFQATIARGLTPFVGRSGALAALKGTLAGPLIGQNRSALVIGEPGIGKSRLCHELLRCPEASEFRVLETSALSYAAASPLSLLIGLLKSMLEIDDEDGPDEIRERVQAVFGALELDPQRVSVALELLDLPTGDLAWRSLDPVMRLRRIEQTLREALAHWCERGPAIVLLEDLHWADPDSRSFLWTLFEDPPRAGMLLLGTLRPEAVSALPALPETLQIDLHALPLDESAALIRALVGADESLNRVRRQLAEQTQGNPLFIEESARTFVDLGMLRGEPGHYVLLGTPEDVSVPAAVEALIATRLDRLPRGELELLQAAGIVGDDSPREVLRSVLGLEESEFEARCAGLAEVDLFYQTGSFRAPVYRFRHALIREVAVRRLLRASQRSLHGRVLETLEQLYSHRLAEYVERLAEHAARAEQWAKAARYHQRAAARAASRWANLQAVEHLERGIEVSLRIDPGAEREQLGVDLRLIALAPLLPMGAHERSIALLREAEASAVALDDRKRMARVFTQLGTALWVTGRYDEALHAAERALALAIELGDFASLTAARHCLGINHHARGRFRDSLEVLNQVLDSLVGPLAHRQLGWAGYPSIFARTFVISGCSLQGQLAEADRVFVEAHALAEAVDHPYSWTMLLEEYSFSQIVRGDFARARELGERSMAICEKNEVRVMYAPTAARLGAALSHCGEAERAKALLEDALARQTYRAAGHYGLVFLLLALADAQLRAGETERALENARAAEAETRAAGEHAYHVTALVQLGDVLARSAADAAEAGGVYEQAVDQARALGMAPFEALALEGRARWLAERGQAPAAAADLTLAEALWSQMNAPARLNRLAELRRSLEADPLR
jgi:class 3 adenylate cyclase/tetratricopeptide (TPR) repeat protein